MDNFIRKYFSYDSSTGVIQRTDRRNSSGSIDAYGYLIIKIKGRQYKAHRLAWFLHFNQWPTKIIDHINRDKLDNRIINLRDVSVHVNILNVDRMPNSTTGVTGVGYDTCTKGLKSKYYTRISGKTYRFRTLQEAITFRDNHFPTIEGVMNDQEERRVDVSPEDS